VDWHQVNSGPTWKTTLREVPASGPVRRSNFTVDSLDRSSGSGSVTPNQPPSTASACKPNEPSV
jgi:hypothetical protein